MPTGRTRIGFTELRKLKRQALLPLVGVALAACGGAEDATSVPVSASEGWAAISVSDAVQLEGVQFLDIRSSSAFEAGHVAGAHHLDAAELRASRAGVAGQALLRDDADAVLAQAGVNAADPIVVYGIANDTSAGRMLWGLAYYGSQSGLRLLDGGLTAWTEAGLPLEEGPATGEAIPWAGGETRATLRVEAAWVLDHLDDPDVEIFDVRSPGEYEAGHVPGAINVPWASNLNGDGLFRDASEVLDLHAGASASTAVVYCQSGARASVSWAVLNFAGHADVRLYDGSWNEWGADAATPKVTGSAPR